MLPKLQTSLACATIVKTKHVVKITCQNLQPNKLCANTIVTFFLGQNRLLRIYTFVYAVLLTFGFCY